MRLTTIRTKGVTFPVVKTMNLKNRNEMRRYRRAFLIVKAQLEVKLKRKMRSYFAQQARTLRAQIKKTTNPIELNGAIEAVVGSPEQLKKGERVLETHYKASFKVADKFISSGVEKALPDRIQYKQDTNFLEQAIVEFIREYTAKHIVGVEDTTKAKVRRIVEIGLTKGKTTIEIEKDIMKAYSGFTLKRAGVIARTETTQAVGTGSRKSFESFGFQNPKKTWLHVEPDNPRPEHKRMDEVTIALDEKYRVDNPIKGTDLMDGPGDNEAPPEQTINCNCLEAFDADDEEL